LQLGLSVDVEAVDPDAEELMKQLKEEPSGEKSTLLNDASV
jgi:hypothetical protein